MLALAEVRAGECPHCAGSLDETTSPANEGRYVPLLPTRCHQCDGLQQSMEAYTEAKGTSRPGALMHRVKHLGPGPTAA
jgi:hypothetical protein